MANEQRLVELAILGLQADRSRIDRQIADLTSQMSRRTSQLPTAPKTELASSSAPTTIGHPTKQVKRKRGLTAEGRRKLSAAAKRRWVASKKAGKTTL